MLFGWVCVVIFCCFAFCFCCVVNVVIFWIIEHTGVVAVFFRAWVLEEEGTIGVGETFGQIIGKNGREKTILKECSVELGFESFVHTVAFSQSGGDCVLCEKIIKGEMSGAFGICWVLLCHFVAKKQIQIVDVVVGVSAVVVGYIYHSLVGEDLILSGVGSAGVEAQEEDQLEYIRALAICKKIEPKSNAADESYMRVINTGAACCERAWWW